MLDLFLKALLKFGIEGFASLRFEVNHPQFFLKIPRGQDAMIEHIEDNRVGNNRAKFFHQVQAQRWTTMTRLLEEAHTGLEAPCLIRGSKLRKRMLVDSTRQDMHCT